MNNVIDSIKLSGTVYTLSAQTEGGGVPESAFTAYTAATDTRISTDEEVTAAALNDLNEAVSGLNESVSGKQDTLIAGDYITIDTANTISTSGLVTVADNEVSGQSVSVSGTWFPSGYQPTPINGDSYSTSFDIVENSINGGEYGQQCNYNTNIIITLIDSSGNTVSGSVGNGYITAATPSDIIPSNMTSYLDAQITIQGRHGYVKYSGKNGWRIKYISNVPLGGLTTFGIYTATRIDFPGGQSARVIENTVFPELKELSQALSGKQDTLVSGTNIKTINNESILGSGNIDIQGGSVTVDDELSSTSENPVQNKVIYNKIDEVEQVTAAGLNALNNKITPTVELTQAEYDALTPKDPNTYYIITDAQAGDLTNYYTKSETNTLLGGKQATLVSGTNIKTINNESILGSGNIDIQGGSITIDPSLNTGSTNAVANSAITNAIDAKADKGVYTAITSTSENGYPAAKFKKDNGGFDLLWYSRINGTGILKIGSTHNTDFSLVETSAITTSVTSSSTDSQIPSAKAVYDNFGGLKLVKLTQAEYNALATKDSSTLYIIVN